MAYKTQIRDYIFGVVSSLKSEKQIRENSYKGEKQLAISHAEMPEDNYSRKRYYHSVGIFFHVPLHCLQGLVTLTGSTHLCIIFFSCDWLEMKHKVMKPDTKKQIPA